MFSRLPSPRQRYLSSAKYVFCFVSAVVPAFCLPGDLPRPEGEQTNWHDTTLHTVVTRPIRPALHRVSLYIILSRRRRATAGRPVFYNMLHFTVWHVATRNSLAVTAGLVRCEPLHAPSRLQTTDHSAVTLDIVNISLNSEENIIAGLGIVPTNSSSGTRNTRLKPESDSFCSVSPPSCELSFCRFWLQRLSV